MAEYIFKTLQELDLPRAEVFEFFSNAENLERITPPELGFNIITPLPIDIKKGTLIDYKLSLHGVPIKWQTEITHWEPPFEFIDMQLSGPYKQWIHLHRFTEPEPGKTLMEDEVRYRLPFEPIGDIGNFMVGGKIKKIFDYRRKAVEEYFSIGA
ncbi:MAG: SRPBCC family protein [Chloracidobacterium sp.]|nr:SRPBCC family protein [Chloracidobacterium sp.]